jgi:2-succinyl-6-hydroxy-2,4-cyclohexadiene-1-carboxylate synthase
VRTLVLHGFAGRPRLLVRFFPAEDTEAPDLPGHASAPEATSWNDAIERLSERLDSGPPTTLFGYSMGARLALALALRRPESIARLVLESGTAGIADFAERARRRIDDDALAALVESEGMEKFVERWEQHPTLASLRPFAAQLRPERIAHRPEGIASALRHLGAGAQPSYWDALPRLPVPVRLIAGVRDEKFSAIARRMHELLPRSELSLIPDCGHAPHVERPQAFVEALR